MSNKKTATKTNKVVKTKNATDVINTMLEIGDKLASRYWESEDLKGLRAVESAYKLSVNTGKTKMVYNKAMGKKTKIAFFE
jgi:hypothetical protein